MTIVSLNWTVLQIGEKVVVMQLFAQKHLLEAKLEEVSMKWMDRPSVAEMQRGGVYEMEMDTWSFNPFYMDRNSSKKNLE